MTNINKVSGNELSELLSLIYEVSNRAKKDYCHVYDLLSEGFKKSLDNETVRLQSEFDKREDRLTDEV